MADFFSHYAKYDGGTDGSSATYSKLKIDSLVNPLTASNVTLTATLNSLNSQFNTFKIDTNSGKYLDKRYYTKAELSTARLARVHWENIIRKPDLTSEGLSLNHNHDNRYYTSTEVDEKLNLQVNQSIQNLLSDYYLYTGNSEQTVIGKKHFYSLVIGQNDQSTLNDSAWTINTPSVFYNGLSSSSGISGEAYGKDALSNNTGSYNTAVGNNSMSSNTTGGYNTAVGRYSLRNNTIGVGNVSLGSGTLSGNVSGHFNTVVGADSGFSGNSNVAIGINALGQTTGDGNIAIGSNAGYTNTTDSNKLYIGGSTKETAIIYGDMNPTLFDIGFPNFIWGGTSHVTGQGLTVNGSLGCTQNISATLFRNLWFDFRLGEGDQVSRGNSGASRALVKGTNGAGSSVLIVNYNSDFTGGTTIYGGVNGPITLSSATCGTNVIGGLIVDGNIIGSNGVGTRYIQSGSFDANAVLGAVDGDIVYVVA